MRRGGFTLIEMMIALSISAVILAAIVGLLTSVWTIAKDASDELQTALHARNVRERLFYDLSDTSGKRLGYGLTSATNVVYADAKNVTAYPYNATNEIWSVNADDATDGTRYSIDGDRNWPGDFLGDDSPFEYLYLKVSMGTAGKPGSAVFHDRLIVPKLGRHANQAQFHAAVGGGNWNWNP